MKQTLILVFLFLSVAVSQVNAQDVNGLIRQGNKLLKDEHYRKAIPFYEKAIQSDPNNVEAYFDVAICYLNRYSREKALEYFLKSYSLDSNFNKHIHYWLGRAYHQNSKFDEAIAQFRQYSSQVGKYDQRQKEIKLYIDQCERAKDFMRNQKNFLVTNLGSTVNSSASDHSPVISSDDSTIYFTSRREGAGAKIDLDGEPFEDMFASKKTSDSTWSEPLEIHINTGAHDASVQLFDNNNQMIIYKNNRGGDIYLTSRDGDKWTDPKPLAHINTRDFESSAFITGDGNTIYFATNHYKKIGDLDIYYCTKNAEGLWSKPKELKGLNINTDNDEDAPFITPDGNTLYFSSRGHKGIGGFDIFKSVKDANGKWSEPENLGYPINTPGDDVYYYLSAISNRGYLASYREGGFGEKDIYEIRPIPPIAIICTLTEDKTGKKMSGLAISLTSLKKTTVLSTTSGVSDNEGIYKGQIMSCNRYKAVIMQGKDTVLVNEFDVPIAATEGLTYSRNFIIPFKGNPDSLIAVKDTIVKDTVVKDTIVKAKPFNLVVYFNTAKYNIGSDLQSSLPAIKEYLDQNKDTRVELAGHTDAVGSDEINNKLSQQRAQAVKDYLIKNGVSKDRIVIMAHGEKLPVGDNNTEEGRRLNRRVEIKSLLK